MKKNIFAGLCFLALFLTSNGLAQTSTNRPAPVVSPEILADRTVTFRLRAPQAREVSISGEWPNGNKPMQRDSEGVWSVTVGPLGADLYGYGFNVEGLRILDPQNSRVKPGRSPTTSILDIQANPPGLQDIRDVPHGTVRSHTYQSKSLGKIRNLVVYTPPGYDQHPRQSYPTLYLFHGSGDNEATWTALGRAQTITDNLLAERKIQPMVIVMTDGHAFINPPGTNSPEARMRPLRAFEQDLLNDVMPFVETNYRVRKKADDRAIVGLSMGGGQSLTIGLNHSDLFHWVGGMSAAVFNPETTVAPR